MRIMKKITSLSDSYRIMKNSLLILVLGAALSLQAAKPNWSVTPSAFLYSMNLTSKLSVNCVDLKDTADMVGAFVAGQCRGVANASNLINGNNLAFLTIYSNSFGGEQIDLRIYDVSLDSVYTIALSLTFQDGAIIGDPGNPYTIHTNAPPTDLNLSKSSVRETQTDAFIGLFSTVDPDSQNHTYQLIAGDGDTNNADFTINQDSLFAIGSFDFDLKRFYSIRVSTDGSGCTFEKVFQISVKDSNHAPTDIDLSNLSLDENLADNYIVGSLSTIDNDAVDQHSYSLISGVGDDDNTSFIIDGDQLRIDHSSNYEDKSSYSILIESDDGDSGSVSKNFVINVNDVNERPQLKDTLLVLSENVQLQSTAAVLDFSDEDQGDTHTWEILGITPFEANDAMLRLSKNLNYEVQNYYEFEVKVTDQGGLSDTAAIIIEVTDEVEPEEGLPVNEILSPNSDGINDYFQIQNVNLYSDFRLLIFNRNGMIIYEVPSNYDNTWGGTFNGNVLDSGVYYYLFQSNADASIKFTGAISIIN